MTINRMYFILGALLICSSLAQAASDDIENRFIYSDYSKKISMDFKDASLMDVLKIFSKQSGTNFISSGDVADKKVTVYLRDIPIEEALDKILDTNDLTYEVSPNSDVFVVKAKDKTQLITKVFPLKYASVTGSKLNGKDSKGGITEAVKGMLSKSGKLQEDGRTNSFVITDEASQFPLIEEMITKLDVSVAQILIQVEMLDVSKSASEQVGILYGNGSPFVSVSGSSRSATFPFSESLIASKTGTSPVSWSTAANGYNFTGMSAALDFLKSRTDTRSLARPKILTLNNQTAEIKIETNEAIGLTSVSTSTTSNSSQTSATAERTKTGVSLEVTPQANISTGEIIMSVKPKVSDATQTVSFGSSTFKNPEERSSESILKVKSGETFIIGGLLITQDQNESVKLPVLGDMPLVGGAFRHKKDQTQERELIIFITPYILDDKIKQKVESNSTVRLDREVGDSHRLDAVSQQLNYSEMGNR